MNSEYERLIKPIENSMMSSIWRITRNPDDADEAFQEALIVIWRKMKKIRNHPNPHALILRMCINSAYDVLRRKSRRPKLEDIHAINPDAIDDHSSTDEPVINEETRDEIFGAIAQLSPNQATAVLMRCVLELPYADIAAALGCREVTVRKHIARARARLFKLLAHLLPQSMKEVQ